MSTMGIVSSGVVLSTLILILAEQIYQNAQSP